MRPRISFACLGLVALLSISATTGCHDATTPENGVENAELRDETPLRAERGVLVETILLTGDIEAARAAPLLAPDVGVWPLEVRWLAEHGSHVQEGAPVAEFDNSNMVSQLEVLRSQIERREQEIRSQASQNAIDMAEAEFAVEQRRAELNKAKLLADVPPDLISARELQEKQLEWERARVELEKAQAQLRSRRETGSAEGRTVELELEDQQYELQRILRSLDRLALTAPRTGLVEVARSPREERLFQAGDTVQPGWEVARVPDLDSLRVRAQLFDVDDGRIESGLPAKVWLDAFPDRPYPGRVTDIDAIARQLGRGSLRRIFEVVIELDERDVERMRPGMSVRVEIEHRHEDVVVAPRPALEIGSAGETAVTLVDGERLEVQLGACDVRACILLDPPAVLSAGADLLSMREVRSDES